MERTHTNNPPLKMSSFSYTDSGVSSSISYESEMEINTSTYSLSLMDPIEAVMRPENVLEKFVEGGGRRYLNDKTVKCFLPSDQKEVERMYYQHYVDKIIWEGDYSAPVSDNLSLG